MELLTLVAVIAIIIIVIIGAISGIKKISAFYKQRFRFSLWSGVLLLVLASSFIILANTADIANRTRYILIAISIILIFLTGFNDIRLAGISWGLLAAGLQILFSFCFVVLIALAVIGFVMKKVLNIHNSVLNSIFGGHLSLRNELLLLGYFLHV